MNKWDIFKHARENDSYYQGLYSKLGHDISWEQVPIVDQKEFWDSHPYRNQNSSSAVIFRSGGTTGKPKCSVFSVLEWREFVKNFGLGLEKSGLKDGDRIGNLFFSGDMYASFLFIKDSLEHAPFAVEHFPISGGLDHKNMAQILQDYPINVLAGVPSALVQLGKYLQENKIKLKIETILFGGEFLFKNQEVFLSTIFPDVLLSSIGHASVDAGHLGKSCGTSSGLHATFNETSLMEIVDEEGQVITNPNVIGRLVYTNLTRKLMPIVRYPVGDNAFWVIVGEKYCLQGRTDEGARIGPVTITREDFLQSLGDLKVVEFQFHLKHSEFDFLEVTLVANDQISNVQLKQLEKSFYHHKPMYLDCVEKQLIAPIKFRQIAANSLVKNTRTGKLVLCIDERFSHQ